MKISLINTKCNNDDVNLNSDDANEAKASLDTDPTANEDKILSFKNKAPSTEDGYISTLRTLYTK